MYAAVEFKKQFLLVGRLIESVDGSNRRAIKTQDYQGSTFPSPNKELFVSLLGVSNGQSLKSTFKVYLKSKGDRTSRTASLFFNDISPCTYRDVLETKLDVNLPKDPFSYTAYG